MVVRRQFFVSFGAPTHDRGQPRVNLASKMHTRTRQLSHLPPNHKELLVGTSELKWSQNYIIDMCLSRVLQKNNGLVKNIGWHSIAHWVAHPVVASTRRATGTFHSHCRTNETKTEPLIMHLRAMRDKCLIKRIRRVVFFAHQRKKFATPYAPLAEQQ